MSTHPHSTPPRPRRQSRHPPQGPPQGPRPRRPTPPGFDLDAFRRQRFAAGLFCPRCGGRAVQRWGRFGTRRRYRCRACARTFSDLTGTPLAYLKRLERWDAFCAAVLDATTVRATARALGVHSSTAFRWRHRLLDALRAQDPTRLAGVVAVHETFFPFSEKGRRDLDRPPRLQRFPYPSLAEHRAWVLLARDSTGRPWSDVVGRIRPPAEAMARSLNDRLEPHVQLSSRHGRFCQLARFARLHGLNYRRLRGRAFVDHPAALYGRDLRYWLRRFRGVATRYLRNYLVWHRFLHRVATRSLTADAARARLVACSFP